MSVSPETPKAENKTIGAKFFHSLKGGGASSSLQPMLRDGETHSASSVLGRSGLASAAGLCRSVCQNLPGSACPCAGRLPFSPGRMGGRGSLFLSFQARGSAYGPCWHCTSPKVWEDQGTVSDLLQICLKTGTIALLSNRRS